MQSQKAVVVPSGEEKLVNNVLVKVTSKQSNGACFVFQAEHAPGEGIPKHVHRDEDEIGYVIEGELEVIVDGEPYRVGQGTSFYLPKNIPHEFRVVGSSRTKSIWTVVPGQGFEKMFVELGSLPSDGPPDMQKMGQIAAKYGIEFLP